MFNIKEASKGSCFYAIKITPDNILDTQDNSNSRYLTEADKRREGVQRAGQGEIGYNVEEVKVCCLSTARRRTPYIGPIDEIGPI